MFRRRSTAQPADPRVPWAARGSKTTKGILIIHGIGEEKKGDTLRGVGTAIVKFLQARLEPEDVDLKTKLGDPTEPAQVTISFNYELNGEQKSERWELIEAWWAQAFEPPKVKQILQWSYLHVWDQLRWSRRSLWRILLGKTYIHWRRTPLGDERDEPVETVETSWRDRFIILYDILAGLLWMPIFVLLTPLVAIVLALLWLLTQVPVAKAAPGVITAFQEAANKVLVGWLGDAAAYTDDPFMADDVREKFYEALKLLEENKCESIFVVAHSWGAVVAFDALSRLAQADRSKVKKLITVGSALNRGWRLSPELCDTLLPKNIRWIDIYARYDLVPAGWAERPKRVENGDKIDSRIVSNHDSIIADHVTYWDNVEEVIAQLVDEIEDETLPTAFDRSKRQASDDGRERKRRLLPLSLLRLIAWGFPLVFFFFLSLNFLDLRADFISGLDKPLIRTPITWVASTEGGETGKFEPEPILEGLDRFGPWALDHLILPLIGTLYVAAASLLLFRFVRDMVWQNYMSREQTKWHRRRRRELAKAATPTPSDSA